MKRLKNLLYATLSAMLFPVFVSDSSLAYSNSVFSVVLLLACYIFLQYTDRQDNPRRLKVFTHILGMMFSVMTAYGYALSNCGTIDYLNPFFVVAILLFAHLYAKALGLLWNCLLKNEASFIRVREEEMDSFSKKRGARFFEYVYQRPALLFILLLIAWLPCYVSTFPGNFVYDASYEYYQLKDGFTKSYPLLHSVIITRLLAFSEKMTGSVNGGIAVYTIIQMAAGAALFTSILRRFYRDAVHPALLGIATLYYALFPVIHLLITCTTRDVLFSYMITWLVYLFYIVAKDPDQIFLSVRKVLLLAAVFVFTLLARNNNSGPLVLILLLAVCVVMLISFGRKYLKSVLAFSAAAIGIFYVTSAVLVSLCQPLYESPPSSSMSILAQPIVRAHRYYADMWPQEDREEFESYFNMETLEYFPQNADPAKGNLTVRYGNMKEFLLFWIKIGLRHPACYMDAILASTQQMWFPSVVLDGYTVRGMFPAYEKNYFYFGKYIEEIGTRLNLLPSVFKYYEQIGLMISFEKIPVISMLFSIGFHFWILLHCVIYNIYMKRYSLLWPISILLIYAVCSSVVPLVLLRYFAALFLSLPIMIILTVCPLISQGEALKNE